MKKTTIRSIVGTGFLAFASSASAAVIFIDFTNAASATATNLDKFNHLNNVPATALSLADSTGVATTATVAVTISNGSLGGNNSGGSTALAGDALTAGFTQVVGDSYHFTSGSDIATYTISGLDATAMTSYTITAFGSRNVTTDTRPTQYTVSNGVPAQNEQMTANPSQPVNNTTVQVFSPITTATGTLTFSVKGLNTSGSNQFGYINALKIESVPEPTSALLLGSAGLLGLLRRRRAQAFPS